ncbi:MAG: hypothetical protein ACHRXM_39345 [Isosphaerales bacterium]
MLFSERWAAPVYLELLTTNTHTTRLEVVSALHGRSMDRVVEGRQLDLEDRVLHILAQSPTLTRTTLGTPSGLRTSAWARRCCRWTCPDGAAARPLVRNAATHRSKGSVPVPQSELRGNGTVFPSTEPSCPVSEEGSCQASI